MLQHTDRSFELLTEQLHDASQQGLLDVVRFLCEQGANKEHADAQGSTPLLHASFAGHLEVVPFPFGQGPKTWLS